jgi:phage tail sheath protein FI
MAAVSYPGVYIEEVPSAVRTITGVATSITAFLGRARRGPVNEPRRITSFADYVRLYGNLWRDSTLSYSVQQYFLNGGSDALITRLVEASAAKAKLVGTSAGQEWVFRATRGGKQGEELAISITHDATDAAAFTIDISRRDADGAWVLVDRAEANLDTLLPRVGLGDSQLVLIDVDSLPSIRPDVATRQPLLGGVDAEPASATLTATDGTSIVIAAATAGAGGRRLRATVSDATAPEPTEPDPAEPIPIEPDPATVNPANYDLLIELLDEDGDPLASVRFENVTPGAAWPVPTPSDRQGTTDDLIDVSAAAPPTRPANTAEPVEFVGGFDVAKASTSIGITVLASLPLEAASEGEWGNCLEAQFDHDTEEPNAALFNLTVRELQAVPMLGAAGEEVAREVFRNLSVNADHARFVTKVLEQESQLVRVQSGASGMTRPAETPSIDDERIWLSFDVGSDGSSLDASHYLGNPASKEGIYAFEKADLFNLMVIPPPTFALDTSTAVWSAALGYCKQRRALLLVDAPSSWIDTHAVTSDSTGLVADLQSPDAINGAIYWPRIKVADPLREFRLDDFPPCGAVAGVMARTDAQFGVWRAPAGTDAALTGARGLSVSIVDREQGQINPLGINVLRSFPVIGRVVWGARTLRGADKLASEWKYVPVRRLALFLEESLYRGTQWAVFAPNDEPLWAQLRLNLGAFMQNLFRQGAFQGRSAREAYLVKCDSETTTQNDIDRGIVNIIVGFAPLKPAEFVVLKFSQLAGQA